MPKDTTTDGDAAVFELPTHQSLDNPLYPRTTVALAFNPSLSLEVLRRQRQTKLSLSVDVSLSFGSSGYVIGILMMAIIIVLGVGITLGYFYKR